LSRPLLRPRSSIPSQAWPWSYPVQTTAIRIARPLRPSSSCRTIAPPVGQCNGYLVAPDRDRSSRSTALTLSIATSSTPPQTRWPTPPDPRFCLPHPCAGLTLTDYELQADFLPHDVSGPRFRLGSRTNRSLSLPIQHHSSAPRGDFPPPPHDNPP
jgi:hypothetical protein